MIQHLICAYWIKGIPADADFPRDVCLTVSRNHKVFLLYICHAPDVYIYIYIYILLLPYSM